jgi:hypothetical protein
MEETVTSLMELGWSMEAFIYNVFVFKYFDRSVLMNLFVLRSKKLYF